MTGVRGYAAHPRSFGALLVVTVGLTSGCASPGLPRPPSLNLPEVVDTPTAERIGDAVHLRWVTSAMSTEGRDVTGSLTAEVCRANVRAGSSASMDDAPCVAVRRLAVLPGAAEAWDLLPPALASGKPSLLGYKITILNQRQRAAGASAMAFAVAGQAPPAITGLVVQSTASGAIVQWKPSNGPFTVELMRGATPSPGRNAQPRSPKNPEEEVRLTPAGQIAGEDPGGTLDTTAVRGQTYRYTAQRVALITLDGHALPLRSTSSAEVSVRMRVSFAPAAPGGLAAIAATQTDGRPAIDLSWRPGLEADLQGYLVYRQDLNEAGAPLVDSAQITPTPVRQAALQDVNVLVGHRYRYMVRAVNIGGDLSATSTATEETLRAP